MDRAASPEGLNDYMRVTGPALSMLMAAVIALLAGMLALASIHPLETTLAVQAQVANRSTDS